MKTLFIILIISFLFIPVLSFAEIHGSVEIGKEPDSSNAFSKINLNYDFNIWIFKTSVLAGAEMWLHHKSGISASPYLALYTIGYKVELEGFYLLWHHYCVHPLYSNQTYTQWQETVKFRASTTTISIGFKW